MNWKVRPTRDPFSDSKGEPETDLLAMVATLGVWWVLFLVVLAVAAVVVAVAVWGPAFAVK